MMRQHRGFSRHLLAVLVLGLSLIAAVAVAERYHYDTAGRLVRVVYDDLSSITYTYDANGNILSVVVTAAGTAGDVDLDGDVDDVDIQQVLTIVLGGGEPYSPTGDCNGDDRVTVLDLVRTITAKGGVP